MKNDGKEFLMTTAKGERSEMCTREITNYYFPPAKCLTTTMKSSIGCLRLAGRRKATVGRFPAMKQSPERDADGCRVGIIEIINQVRRASDGQLTGADSVILNSPPSPETAIIYHLNISCFALDRNCVLR